MTSLLAALGCGVAAGAALMPLRRGVFVAVAVLGVMMWGGAVWQGGVDAARPLAAVCVFLAVVLLRRLLQDRRRAAELLGAERAAHAAQLEVAAVAERERIARDLHDGLTHLLTSQLLVLQTARAALADDDTATADARVLDAVGLSRRTLVEARDVIDVLRGHGPDLDLLRATVTEWAAATGHHVELLLPQRTPKLGGVAWGAVLATLREALTNVARHRAGAQVRVRLVDGAGGLDLTVEDFSRCEAAMSPPVPTPVAAAPLPAGGGMGLQGLRERAALAGGTLSACPAGDGWCVRLALPTPAPR